MIEMMTHSDNIDFTPSLRRLFANARHDYFLRAAGLPHILAHCLGGFAWVRLEGWSNGWRSFGQQLS